MTFLPIALSAYILNGFSLLIDKSLVDTSIKSPFVYTFYIGILSLAVLILLPFGFYIPSTVALVFSVLSGIFFVLALLFFFDSLKTFEVTVASPIIGTLNPVFSLIVGALIFSEKLSAGQYIAFGLLLLSGAILTHSLWWGKRLATKKFIKMVTSGAFFGLGYIFLREAFISGSFVDGLVLSRLAMAVSVLSFLFIPDIRRQIFASKLTRHHFSNPTFTWVLVSQSAGAVSGLMLSYSVYLASAAIVNSLHGIQYVVLSIGAIILAKKHPELLKETISLNSLFYKAIGLIIMALGLVFLGK